MIGKYRKKPVIIEAFQFWLQSPYVAGLDGDGIAEYIKNEYDAPSGLESAYIVGNKLMIETLEGVIAAEEGDWIIRGVAGEFYPCKPHIFEATYEPVAWVAVDANA